MNLQQRLLPWLMWFFPLVFFGFQFILRLFPGLVMGEFLEKYRISATDFGLFASLYYLGYAGMQIPMAVLLEKYGPRLIISFSAVLCGIATCLSIAANCWSITLLSRFLVGVGSVVGFLGVSKVISLWFPATRYTRLVGLTFSFGLLGALYGGKPVSLLIENWGWEKVSLGLGIAAILIGFFSFVFVRDKTSSGEKPPQLLHSLKCLFCNKPLVILAFSNFLMVGSLEGFADVWGIPYLMAARNISKMAAASLTSYIFIGMLFGGPLLAYFAEKFKAYFLVTSLCGIMMALLLTSILAFNAWLPQWALALIMFSIGLLCCYQVIVFAIGTQLVPSHLMSIAVAFLNCINMLGGSFFHTMIGRLMDYFQGSSMLNGVKSYALDSYTYTFALIPIASLIGAGLVWWSKIQQRNNMTEMRDAQPTTS